MYAHVIHCNDRKPCLRPSRPQHHAGFQPPSWLWVCWGLEAQLTVTKPMTKTRAQTLSQAVAVGGVSVRILPWRLFDFSSQFWHKPSAMRSPSTSPVSQADLQTAEHPHRLSSPQSCATPHSTAHGLKAPTISAAGAEAHGCHHAAGVGADGLSCLGAVEGEEHAGGSAADDTPFTLGEETWLVVQGGSCWFDTTPCSLESLWLLACRH